MEGWFSMCFIALCTPLALWLLKLASTKNKPQKQQQLPPGPWTLPIIGSLHHVASILPHCTMMKLSRRHGALMLLRLGEVPIVIVSSAEVAAEVMKTNDPTFASRSRRATSDFFGSGGKGIVYAPYGDHWRQMRKICVMELLSSTQVKRMEAIRAEKVMALSNDMMTRAVFGGKFPHQGEYLRELAKAFTMLGGFSMLDLFPSSRLVRWLSNDQRQMKSCYGRMHRIIADVVEERKATRAARAGISIASDEDMLDVLLRLQQEDSLIFPLTTQTMGAILFDVFAGATESGGNVLAWAMSELMHSPNTMVKAQEEVREVLGEGRAVTSRKPTFDPEH